MSIDLREQLQQTLGEAYRLERELGGGGMSRVFLAVETALGRNVVVKVLLPDLAAGVSVDRFRREIQLAAQLQHPHIVPLLAAGESAGLPFFTMPFVVGESLRARLVRDRELPVPETIRLLRDVASALDYAHARGVVHRDIKPDNVLLTHRVAVVTDFGVAKALSASAGSGAHIHAPGVTTMGVTLGTPAYMAPEQASADPNMDHRVDIYAYGIMAYEMLAGQTPFTARTPQALLGAHLAALPEPVTTHRPGLPPALATIVMQCLEKHPADRPQTAGDLIVALDALTTPSGGTIPVRASTAPARPAPPKSRPRLLVAALAVVTGAAVAVWVWSAGRERPRASESPVAAVGPAAPKPASEPMPGAPRDTAVASAPDSASVSTPVTAPLRAPVTPPPPEPAAAPKRASPPAREPSAPAVARREDEALLARLDGEARQARVRAVQATGTPALIARGDSALARAESLRTARRPAEAAVAYGAATTAWQQAAAPRPVAAQAAPPAPAPPAVPPTPAGTRAPQPPPPPPDPAPQIRALFATYAAAVETRNVANIRQAYPGLRPEQAREWEQFFSAVDAVEVKLDVTRLDVRGDTGEASVSGVYVFIDPATRRRRSENVSFLATLQRDTRGWRIESLR